MRFLATCCLLPFASIPYQEHNQHSRLPVMKGPVSEQLWLSLPSWPRTDPTGAAFVGTFGHLVKVPREICRMSTTVVLLAIEFGQR